MSQDVGEADRIDLDRLRSRHEGVEVSMDVFQVWTFRDGLAVKHESFLEREVALRAAGLSEQAMSQENVEIVLAGIEAFNRRDWDGALSDATPGFKIDMSRAVGPISGVYGLDQIREVWDDLADIFESSRIEPHEFIEAGEHVVVPWTFHAMGRDGIDVQARTTWTFTIRDGAVELLCMYQERHEAFEAAGLQE